MAEHGGPRKGAGRKSIAAELQTSDLARQVLIKKFGGLNEALIALLDMGEPALTKFVFEHAFGKSPDKIEHSAPGGINMIFTASNGCAPLPDESDAS